MIENKGFRWLDAKHLNIESNSHEDGKLCEVNSTIWMSKFCLLNVLFKIEWNIYFSHNVWSPLFQQEHIIYSVFKGMSVCGSNTTIKFVISSKILSKREIMLELFEDFILAMQG